MKTRKPSKLYSKHLFRVTYRYYFAPINLNFGVQMYIQNDLIMETQYIEVTVRK